MTKKIIEFLAYVAVLTLMSTMFFTIAEPVKAAEQVTIANHQGFLDSAGYYVVYGEVKNTGDTAAKNIGVKTTFYDSSNAVLDQGELSTKVDILLPGRRAPFSSQAGVDGTLVKSYKVELMDLTMSADSLPLGLEIVSSTAEVKSALQSMMLNGQVKNNGAQIATYVKVAATFYDGPDGTGNVVGAASATANPSDLNSGQTGTFQTGIPVGVGKSYVSYVLTAESNEYTAIAEYVAAIGQTSSTSPSSSANLSPSPSVPEFPSTVVAALIIVAMLMVAVLAKRKQR
jgi:hypothetical protein